MNAKPEIMHVLPMKNVTIPEAVTNVSIWDVHLDTNRYRRVQPTGKIIFSDNLSKFEGVVQGQMFVVTSEL